MLFRERQQIAICVAAGVIVSGFVLLRYLPLQERIKAVKQARTAQRLAITKSIADSRQLPLLKEQLQKLQRQLGKYEANIPERRAIGTFLHRVTNLMNEHNLREQVIAPREEMKADGLNCIPVNMRCKGNLTQIFEFYRRLQASDRLVRIEHVKLVNDSDLGGEVSMETRAVIYYRARVGQG